MPVAPFVPLIAAGVGAGGAILSANASNRGQQQAANASQQAADAATAEQRRQYDLSRADNAPWLATGQSALNQLASLYNLNGQGGGTQDWNQYLTANPDVQTAVQGGAFGGEGGLTGAAQRHYNEYGRTEGRAAPGMSSPMDAFVASPDYQFRQSEQARALTARNAALGIQDSGAAQRSALQYSGNLASGEFNNYANRLSALAGVGQTAAGQNQALGTNYASAVTQIGQNNAQNLASSYTQRGETNSNLYAGLTGGLQNGLLNGFAPRNTYTTGAPTTAGSTYFAGLYR